MAPIKFEENIKDKLEQRTIQPSSDVWSKLSERLDAEPKKKKIGYWWLGIAASFVGLLIVSSILFSGDSGDNNAPVIVDDNTENTVNDAANNSVVNEEEVQKIEIAIEQPEIKSEIPVKEITKLIKPEQKNKTESVVFTQQKDLQKTKVESVAQQETIIATDINEVKTTEDLKVDEVVTQILKLQEQKSTVTDAEIDALLKQAERELMSKRLYEASTQTVDAELLLLQVESDIDQSFRDRVFDALKSGYKKVKTAVAERNN